MSTHYFFLVCRIRNRFLTVTKAPLSVLSGKQGCYLSAHQFLKHLGDSYGIGFALEFSHGLADKEAYGFFLSGLIVCYGLRVCLDHTLCDFKKEVFVILCLKALLLYLLPGVLGYKLRFTIGCGITVDYSKNHESELFYAFYAIPAHSIAR